MVRNELANALTEILAPIGFKRKGNYWVVNCSEINKLVNLQKSQYSNTYYLNYGFIIKSIPLDNLMTHTYNRISIYGNNEAMNILNLENDIEDNDRKLRLKEIILQQLMPKMQTINSEQDVLDYIKTLPTFNTIPGVVKEYFKLKS